MIGRKSLLTVGALLVLLTLAPAALAQSKVKLRNGRELTGDVKPHETDGWWVQTENGRIHVAKVDVESIEELPDVPAVKDEQIADPAELGRAADAAKARRAQNDEARSEFVEKERTEAEKREFEQLRFELLSGLGDKDTDKRAEAGKRLLSLWPTTAPILDAALTHKTETVRLEAVKLLESPVLGDPSARIERMFKDSAALVQVLAVRTVRHRKLKGLEGSLTQLLASVREWPVHQEVLRTLEDLGSVNCLHTVMDAYAETKGVRERKAFVRVLKQITRADEGDDTDAWRKVVDKIVENMESTKR